MTKKPVKTIASACGDLIVIYLVIYCKINQWNYVCDREPDTSTMFVKPL